MEERRERREGRFEMRGESNYVTEAKIKGSREVRDAYMLSNIQS